MRYHITIAKVPDVNTAEQDWFHDEEFTSEADMTRVTEAADALTTRLSFPESQLAARQQRQAEADFHDWDAGRPWIGFHDTDRPDPHEVYMAGHEAGYKRGLAG